MKPHHDSRKEGSIVLLHDNTQEISDGDTDTVSAEPPSTKEPLSGGTHLQFTSEKRFPHKILASDDSHDGRSPLSSPKENESDESNESNNSKRKYHSIDYESSPVSRDKLIRPNEIRKTFSSPTRAFKASCWTLEEHRAFVTQLFQLGLRKASPCVIMDAMTSNSQRTCPELTKEVIKSHLQKYRVSNEKSRAEFLNEYDAWMRKSQTRVVHNTQRKASPIVSQEALAKAAAISKPTDKPSPAGGEVAACLSMLCMMEEAEETFEEADIQIDLGEYSNNVTALLDLNRPIAIPTLTPEEQDTPLGLMITHTIGCLSILLEGLDEERLDKEMADMDDFSDSSCSAGIFDHHLIPPSSDNHPRLSTVDTASDHHPMLRLPHLIMSPPRTVKVSKTSTEGCESDIPPYELPPAAESNAHRISSHGRWVMPQASHVQLSQDRRKGHVYQSQSWQPPVRIHCGTSAGFKSSDAVGETSPVVIATECKNSFEKSSSGSLGKHRLTLGRQSTDSRKCMRVTGTGPSSGPAIQPYSQRPASLPRHSVASYHGQPKSSSPCNTFVGSRYFGSFSPMFPPWHRGQQFSFGIRSQGQSATLTPSTAPGGRALTLGGYSSSSEAASTSRTSGSHAS